MTKERQQYEATTTNVLVATIVIIILGMGVTSIGLSGQATADANQRIFSFPTNDLEIDLQNNITSFLGNTTEQLNTLTQLTQTALAFATRRGGPPNGTVISSGYLRIVPYSCTSVFPFGQDYNMLSAYPNTTWQVYRTELDFGFVIYILHVDPQMSAPVFFDNVMAGDACAVYFQLDSVDLVPNTAVLTSTRYFLMPNPFEIISGANATQYDSVFNTGAYLQTFGAQPSPMGALFSWLPAFTFTESIPGGVTMDFKIGSMVYIPIS